MVLGEGRVKGEARIGRFGLNARKVNSPLFDEIRIAGSGSDHFLRILENVDLSSLQVHGESNPLLLAIGKTLVLSGYIIGNEIGTLSNLSSFYGGGFELVSIVKGKFEKIGDITYIFWVVDDLSKDGLKFRVHPLAIKFHYSNDVLLIRRTEFQPLGPDNSLQGKGNDSLFLVSPIHRNIAKSEIDQIKINKLPDLNSRFFCHYIIVAPSGSSPEVLVIVDKDQSEMVKFTKEGDKLFLSFHNNFAERLVRMIRERRG